MTKIQLPWPVTIEYGTVDVKPCPYCGSERKPDLVKNSKKHPLNEALSVYGYSLRCLDCFKYGPYFDNWNPFTNEAAQKCIEAWNSIGLNA